jgi:hypothetical protein
MFAAPVAIVIVLLLVVGPVLAFFLAREVAKYRRLGISEESPGCGRCCYRLRGWPGPTCPECGANLREVGVVTGSRWARSLGMYVLASLAALSFALVLVVSRAFLAVQSTDITQQWTSIEVPRLEASLTWRQTTGPFNRIGVPEAELTIAYVPIEPGADRETRPVAWANTLDAPAETELAAVIASLTASATDAAGAPITDAARSTHAAAMRSAFMPMTTAAANGVPAEPTSVYPWGRSASGLSMSTSTHWAVTLVWIPPVVIFAVGAVIVRRRCGPGRRPVREGEWR